MEIGRGGGLVAQRNLCTSPWLATTIEAKNGRKKSAVCLTVAPVVPIRIMSELLALEAPVVFVYLCMMSEQLALEIPVVFICA